MSTLVRPPKAEHDEKRTPNPQTRVFNLPLTAGALAVLQVPATLTEKDWHQFQAILQAMKPGIVTEEVVGYEVLP